MQALCSNQSLWKHPHDMSVPTAHTSNNHPMATAGRWRIFGIDLFSRKRELLEYC